MMVGERLAGRTHLILRFDVFRQNEMCVPAEEGTRGMPPYLCFLSDLFPK